MATLTHKQGLAEDCGAHAMEYFGGPWKFKNYNYC